MGNKAYSAQLRLAGAWAELGNIRVKTTLFYRADWLCVILCPESLQLSDKFSKMGTET